MSSTAQQFAAAYLQDSTFSAAELQKHPNLVHKPPYIVDATTDRIQVPNDPQLRQTLLQQAHDSLLAGHFGQEKTQELLQRTFSWPGLARDVTRLRYARVTPANAPNPPLVLPVGSSNPSASPTSHGSQYL